MGLPKIIENNRKKMVDTLLELAKEYKELSIATGYWDLPGTQLIFEEVKNYKKIRLLIGQEPLMPRYSHELGLVEPDPAFPDKDVSFDLAHLPQESQYRELVTQMKQLIADGRLEVRVYRRSFLHAKCYIFGSYEGESAVGVIGSSNFTRAGLTKNTELNALEDDHRIVKFKPQNGTDEYGHLSWFDTVWNDELTEVWDGKFSQLLGDSPVGDLVFGAHDVYVKTLMEVFPDELVPKPELGQSIQDILYSFQNRNAGILVNKLEKLGMAILADSVGLGKTITAGAVMRHYIDRGAKRVVVIVPASLKQQWKDDLAAAFGLLEGSDFQVVSQQDLNAMDSIAQLDKYKQVDLFIVDEAHNLRSTSSTRYEHILEWFQGNTDSKVLLLTATPINNSLNDLTNQIQLGLKGEFDSILVPYRNPSNNRLETVDFFEALNRIQRRSNSDPEFDWASVKPTLASGISHYLVRSTRQGVEKEGGIISKDGTKKAFPQSVVGQIEYRYSDHLAANISRMIADNVDNLEGIDARKIDLEALLEATQRSSHPLDFARDMVVNDQAIGAIPNIFQLVALFGFTPYKPDIYQHKFYKKTPEEIRNLGVRGKDSQLINLQLSIHNMLLVTWLKRLESSAASLFKSIQTYERRLESFRSYLEHGYILSFADIDIVEQEYGEDLERAFMDYDESMPNETDTIETLKRKGVERRPADDTKYNINAMLRDVDRDRLLAKILQDLLWQLIGPENDSKLHELAKYLEHVTADGRHGKKVLVFSFFADTVNYLRENLGKVLDIHDFAERAEFISGQSGSVENIVQRFSPSSKKYELKGGEKDLDFLFATDILSEGQNLQDSGILVNYDLHWNPVRMIQRNGRVNRLGSKHREVLISNLKPEDNIELYLNLVARLQKKIRAIKNTVGLDQGVLSNDDINPLEYTDNINKLYDSNKETASKALEALEDDDDILSWTNDHVYVLRDFLENASEGDVERIKSIPAGKWNYLPSTTKVESGKALSLLQVEGKTSITNQPITQTFFIETTTSDEYPAEVVDDFLALQNIQTKPEDNERLQDHISVDREVVKRRASRTAKRRAEVGEGVYTLKPRQLEALEAIQIMFPDVPLRPLMENGIRDSRRRRQFENLVRQINSDVRNSGTVLAGTASLFSNLITDLNGTEREPTIVNDVTPLLHYARRHA